MSGRTAIVPKFRLSGHHNWGYDIVSDLSTYFDLDGITIRRGDSRESVRVCWGDEAESVLSNEKPVFISAGESPGAEELLNVECVAKRVDETMSRNAFGVWSELSSSTSNMGLSVDIPYSELVIRETNLVTRNFADDGRYAAIHIRRGDKIQDTAKYTHPELVIQYLKETVKNQYPVYLLTNDDSVDYVNQINQGYPLTHYRNFRNLLKIVCKTRIGWLKRRLRLGVPDNFLLYAIEMNILRKSTLQICTFKTPYSNYHLCPDEGWV